MTNLDKLYAKEAAMTMDELHSYDRYLLGALSQLVTDSQWEKAMGAADQCVERAQTRLAEFQGEGQVNATC